MPGKEDRDEVRTFATITSDLLDFTEWLDEAKCTHLAMESTGVYWKPIYNILAAAGFEVLLVNAKHIKNVLGRKTDVQDCRWKGSRRHQHQTVSGADRRGGQLRMGHAEAIVAGESDAEKMADLARGRLTSKRKDLVLALEGRVTEHHRFMLRWHIHQIEFLDTATGEYDQCIEEQTHPFDEYLPLIDTIPVSNHAAACALFAELGANMHQSPRMNTISAPGRLYARETTRARASISAGKHHTGANACGHCC